MKHLISSLLLCFFLSTQSLAGSYYKNNDWRDLPFVEMMAAMIRAMNNIMGGGGNHYYSSLYGLPYSPAFAPGMNSLYGMNNFSGNGFPANNFTNTFSDNFPIGQNTNNTTQGSFWDLNSKTPSSSNKPQDIYQQNTNNSMNGIWQSQTGNVIAIYNGNYFIWSDGHQKNIAGRLAIKNNRLYAYIPASKTTLQFLFYQEPGQFIVKDKNARIYTFKRIH